MNGPEVCPWRLGNGRNRVDQQQVWARNWRTVPVTGRDLCERHADRKP
jgi:hypothetical protein